MHLLKEYTSKAGIQSENKILTFASTIYVIYITNFTIYRIYLTANNSNSLLNLEVELGDVLVYPVPASNNLNIDLQTKNPLEINVSLLDLNLKKISTFCSVNLNPGKHTFPLSISNVANGFYYLEIKSEKTIIRKKVQVFH